MIPQFISVLVDRRPPLFPGIIFPPVSGLRVFVRPVVDTVAFCPLSTMTGAFGGSRARFSKASPLFRVAGSSAAGVGQTKRNKHERKGIGVFGAWFDRHH